ncbi:MAG: HAD hydrolase-like protein [Gammaproteobacteria bacterium]|nr:HAD hydrolase-like protein [Gammaproteobacteria bacterium]
MADARRTDPRVLERLHRIRGYIFDMDGTLVLGDKRNKGLKPLPGALAITRWLTARAVPWLLFTNGTTRTPHHYAQSLRDEGFAITDAQLMTPASSAADLFARRGYRRVLVLGGDGLSGPLHDAGIETVQPGDASHVDAVLIGWYPEFTMAALEAACHAIWDHGARVFSASQVMFFATAGGGRGMGTSRPISAMLRDLTRCRVEVVGKPSLYAVGSAARRLGVKLRDLAVVGDDPELEVPMAHRGRGCAIAVNTGLGNDAVYARLPEAQRPHLTVDGIDELLALLEGLAGAGAPGRVA